MCRFQVPRKVPITIRFTTCNRITESPILGMNINKGVQIKTGRFIRYIIIYEYLMMNISNKIVFLDCCKVEDTELCHPESRSVSQNCNLPEWRFLCRTIIWLCRWKDWKNKYDTICFIVWTIIKYSNVFIHLVFSLCRYSVFIILRDLYIFLFFIFLTMIRNSWLTIHSCNGVDGFHRFMPDRSPKNVRCQCWNRCGPLMTRIRWLYWKSTKEN